MGFFGRGPACRHRRCPTDDTAQLTSLITVSRMLRLQEVAPCADGTSMSNSRTQAQALAKMLETLAASPDPRRIEEIASQCELTEDAARAALVILEPLALFAEKDGMI